MTDEGFQGDPMGEVEVFAAMRNMAKMARKLYEGFVEEGFTESEATKMVWAWLHGTAGGRFD